MKVILAALLLFASPSFAQSFPASDQLFLPVAGHLVNGATTFATDVTIVNHSDDPVSVSVTFARANTSDPLITVFRDAVKLAPHERRELQDFLLATLYIEGVGMLVFNGCKEGRDCTISFPGLGGTNPNYRLISVASRTYSYPSFAATLSGPPAPTVGQSLSAIPWRQTATLAIPGMDPLQINGIRWADRWRTNLGLANGSEFSSCVLIVKLFDGSNGLLLDQKSFRMGPLGNFQMSAVAMFPQLGATSRLNRRPPISNPYVIISQADVVPTSDAAANGCADGCPAYLAYGSMLDNQTQDATTLEAEFAGELLSPQSSGIFSGASSHALEFSARALSKGALEQINGASLSLPARAAMSRAVAAGMMTPEAIAARVDSGNLPDDCTKIVDCLIQRPAAK